MGRTILLADDDADLRGAVRELLSDQGYLVVEAADGESAMGILRARPIDLVLLDIQMPKHDGLDVLRAVREHAAGLEAIVMSAHGDHQHAVAAARLGAADYLRKPVAADVLLAAVAHALSRRDLGIIARLAETTRALLDVREPQRLATTIVEEALRLLDADDVSLMLPGEGDVLYVAQAHALSAEVRETTRVALGEGIAGRVALTGEPVVLNDLGDDLRFRDVGTKRRVESSIVYPLKTNAGRVVGVLSFSRLRKDHPFGNAELRIASALASQVLLALENARLVTTTVEAERLACIGQLAASITHEINNPVAYVMSSQAYLDEQLQHASRALDAITDDADPARVREALQAARRALAQSKEASAEIRDGARRVRSIVHDMRSLTRVDEDTAESFNVNDAIRSALRMSRTQMLHATVDATFGDGVTVRGNPGRLSQVFVNLLVNASHAVARAGGRITITSRRDGATAIVDVRDNGCGIPREARRRIFEPFFTTKDRATGTGMGLAISRDIVRAYGGDILVESEEGKGATFRVVLELAAEALPRAPMPPVSRAPNASGALMRILFVEDERLIRRGYERVFARTDDIEIVESAEHAWELLAQGRTFDVIVCDLLMPGLSGIDLYNRVCTNLPALRDAFIFVTGGAADPDAEAFLATVANPVLTKPFETADLTELIDRRRPRPTPNAA